MPERIIGLHKSPPLHLYSQQDNKGFPVSDGGQISITLSTAACRAVFRGLTTDSMADASPKQHHKLYQE